MNKRFRFIFSVVFASVLGSFAFAGPISVLGIAAQEGIPRPQYMGRGITETIDEIMARDVPVNPEGQPPALIKSKERELGREELPVDPRSPWISQWPPAPPTYGRPASNERSFFNNRPILRPGRYSPQTLGTNFQGIQVGESGAIPPDTVGAVSPTQILVATNGRIKIFSKAGVLGSLNTSLDTFFNSVRNGSGTSDPVVRYDRLSGRFFVSAVNLVQPNRILIAVSSTGTITGTGSFTFFQFTQDAVGVPGLDAGGFADYDTLAVDNNAVYIGANLFRTNSTVNSTLWVINKANLIGGSLTVTAFRSLVASPDGPTSPRGADSDDATQTEGYVLGVDAFQFGQLCYRRISNPGGAPTIGANTILVIPATVFPRTTLALGSTAALDALDDRFFQAMIRLNRNTGVRTLVTAHNIQVNSAGVASGSGGRNGSRWYEIGNLTGTWSLVQSGTLFDSAASNPQFFTIPSIAKSGQGHMAMGITQSGAALGASVGIAGRWSSDALGTIQGSTIAQASLGNYNVEASAPQRWGDYSATCVDPSDDMTMWTFQEYCNGNNSWAVRVVKINAPAPPTISSVVPNSGNQGASNINLIVTGTSLNATAFFDTDASYTQRLTASFSGTGITVNSAVRNSDTQVTVNISISAGATLGARTLTITNPDGQFVTTSFTVNSGITTVFGSSYIWGPGNPVSGNLASLQNSDNDKLIGMLNPASEDTGDPVTLTVNATSPVVSPTSMQFKVELAAEIDGCNQRLELFNWSNGQFEQIDDRAALMSDQTVTITLNGTLSRFVRNTDRAMIARIGLRAVTADVDIPYKCYIDLVNWLIQ